MLELRKYPKAELSALFGTRDTQGLKETGTVWDCL